jgi:hypothetical protein
MARRPRSPVTYEHAGTPLLSIYNGGSCVGFVLACGRGGYEAFDAGERSLGLFKIRDAAIGELMKSKTPAG